ncbi:MAG TPA: PhzF family phenazine biosynthesis protein [Candidatus Angelobacter sp.]|jgi:trans-2,3-dihydro-3-hydroxyanthranilate isomerase|nr:PhzF family phenazine biosynthesis protein [Candidatus Angelobacter sp.]
MSNQKRRLSFVQVDVFTSVPLEGNQLAVFADGSSLSDAEMQALAKETNLSETTFILPRDAATERVRGVRVRIFTTSEELPFAGHPTLGTAMVLRNDSLRGKGAAEEIALELNIGRIPVRFSTRDGLPFGLMTQRDPEFMQKHSREEVARASGLAIDDIAGDVPIQTVSTGNPFAIVPLKSLATLQKLSPSWASMKTYLDNSDAKFLYFVSRETLNPEAKLQSRMFFYNGEDPATGSAAGPCAAWAVQYGVVPADQQVLMEQGVEMKRRSRIFFSAGRHGDKIVNVRVGGHVAEVARGEFIL